MATLTDALDALSSSNVSYAAALISDAGYPSVAAKVHEAGIMGAPADDLKRIATNLLTQAGANVDTAPSGALPTSPPVPVPVSSSSGGGLGGLIGGAVGSLIPGIGTAAGGTIGTAIGGLLGGGGGNSSPNPGPMLPNPGYTVPYTGPTGVFAGAGFGPGGLSDTPIIPGGVLTPGIGPTFGQVSDIFQDLFGPSTNGTQTPTMPAPPAYSLAGTNLAKPTAHAQLAAPAPGFVIAKVKATDPLFTPAVAAGGIPQPDGSVKIAMRKEYAKAHGYWKPRAKPLISAAQAKRIRKAKSDLARAKKVVSGLSARRKSCR